MHPAQVRLNVRVFSAFLIVGVVMLAATSFFAIGIGQSSLRDALGEHMRRVADQTAAAVDTYVFRLVIDTSVLASVPAVREVALAGSQHPFDRQAATAADQVWQQVGIPLPDKEIGLNKASAFLVEATRQNAIYKHLLLTDRFGRVVATSGSPGGFYYAEARWWKETFDDGTHGRLVVSDMPADPRAASRALEITAPVSNPADGQVTGVLRAVVDMRELGAMLAVRMGSTGDAALLREDGSFVLAHDEVAPNAQFFATDLLRERVASVKKGQPQSPLYFRASAAGGPRLVGVAVSQLKATFPHLSWLVAVSQAEDELFAPVRAQTTSLLIVLGLTVIAVLLFAVWYSMRLAATPEPEEMDMHLTKHPRVHRLEEPEGEEEEAESSQPATV